MKRLLLLPLLLLGCQTPTPPALPAGSLNIGIRWPQRTIQSIPLSTQTIRVRVTKGTAMIQELSLSRPAENGGVLAAKATLRLEADSGLTVRVEALRDGSDVAIASGTQNDVRIVPNQRTHVTLDLLPVFVPTLTDITPKNGGPGVSVTLTGTFGESGYYGLRMGSAQGGGALDAGNLVAQVPSGARSGSVMALADGVPSAPGPSFQVLSSLLPAPLHAAISAGRTLQFSATAQDTEGETVTQPTITRWEVLDPSQPGMRDMDAVSPVGTIDPKGLFTAQQAGTAWVRVRSGSLSATASLTVL